MPELLDLGDFQRQMEVRKSFLQITKEDVTALRGLAPLLERNAERIVEEFYTHLGRFPELTEMLGLADMARLKEVFHHYLLSLSEGKFDRGYFRHRLAIGESHVRVGLDPRWFLGAFGFFLTTLTSVVCAEQGQHPAEGAASIVALQKAIILDVNIALETYYGAIRKEEIERTEERHRAIVENATDVIWAFTPDGTITYMNRGLCGYSKEAFLKKGLRLLDTLQISASKIALSQAIERIKNTRAGIENVETILINPNTLARETYRSNLTPVHGPDGSLTMIQGVTRDVTEVMKLQKKVIDRERLATVGRMAATVAHEIRNPLAGIRGALETLRPKFKGTEREQAILQDILERIDLLNATVQDLLIFSRPPALERMQVPVRSFLEGTVALLREDPIFSSVRVVYQMPDALQAYLDPQQGKLAFTNLLLNAAQAMNGGGRVLIQATPKGGTVEILVEDTGPGIMESAREEIFNPFFTTKPHGTGLGLSIVRWIIEAHGGSITLEPSTRSGAHFLIVLPSGGK